MSTVPDNFPQLVRQLFIEKYYPDFKGYDKLYMLPDLPGSKLANVLKTYAEGLDVNDILLLYDNTMLGSAKDGFLITDQAIYWHNANGPFKVLAFTAINHVFYETNPLSRGLYLNHTEKIATALLKPAAAESITKMLKEFVSITSGLVISEDTGDAADGSVSEDPGPVKKSFSDTMKELGSELTGGMKDLASGIKEDAERLSEATPGLHKLPQLGDPTGRKRQVIEELLGTPASLTKTCPACAEAVLLAAKKCRFCGEVLEPLESYLAQWITVLGEHLVLEFDKDDVCKGIASHAKPL